MAQIWFVTGGSRGLGRSVVEAAFAAGQTVIATARKPEQLDDLVAKHGERVLLLALDAEALAQSDRKWRDVSVSTAG